MAMNVGDVFANIFISQRCCARIGGMPFGLHFVYLFTPIIMTRSVVQAVHTIVLYATTPMVP